MALFAARCSLSVIKNVPCTYCILNIVVSNNVFIYRFLCLGAKEKYKFKSFTKPLLPVSTSELAESVGLFAPFISFCTAGAILFKTTESILSCFICSLFGEAILF